MYPPIQQPIPPDKLQPWLSFPGNDQRSLPSNWEYVQQPVGYSGIQSSYFIKYKGPDTADGFNTGVVYHPFDLLQKLPNDTAGGTTDSTGPVYGGGTDVTVDGNRSAWDIYADINRAQFNDWYNTYRPIEMQQFDESIYGADPAGYINGEVTRATEQVNQGFDRAGSLTASNLARYGMAPSQNRQLQSVQPETPAPVVAPVPVPGDPSNSTYVPGQTNGMGPPAPAGTVDTHFVPEQPADTAPISTYVPGQTNGMGPPAPAGTVDTSYVPDQPTGMAPTSTHRTINLGISDAVRRALAALNAAQNPVAPPPAPAAAETTLPAPPTPAAAPTAPAAPAPAVPTAPTPAPTAPIPAAPTPTPAAPAAALPELTRSDFASMDTTSAVLAASQRNTELQRGLALTTTANGMRKQIVDRSRQTMAGGSMSPAA